MIASDNLCSNLTLTHAVVGVLLVQHAQGNGRRQNDEEEKGGGADRLLQGSRVGDSIQKVAFIVGQSTPKVLGQPAARKPSSAV